MPKASVNEETRGFSKERYMFSVLNLLYSYCPRSFLFSNFWVCSVDISIEVWVMYNRRVIKKP